MRDDDGIKPLANGDMRAKVDAALADATRPVKRGTCACGRVVHMPELPPDPIMDAMARALSEISGLPVRVTDRPAVKTKNPSDGLHTNEGCLYPVPGIKGMELGPNDPVPCLFVKPGTSERVYSPDMRATMEALFGNFERYAIGTVRSLDDPRLK